MPNNVLAGVIERLEAQVTLDAPLRAAWMKDLKKWHPNLTNLQSLADSATPQFPVSPSRCPHENSCDTHLFLFFHSVKTAFANHRMFWIATPINGHPIPPTRFAFLAVGALNSNFAELSNFAS